MNFAWALPIIGAALSFAGGWQEHFRRLPTEER